MAAFEKGTILEGKVTATTKFGAFVQLPGGRSGMVHISEISGTYVKEVTDYLTVGQQVRVMVLGEDEKNRISLSVKQVQQAEKAREPVPAASFEDMLSKFMTVSSDKISDLKKGDTGRSRRSGNSNSNKR